MQTYKEQQPATPAVRRGRFGFTNKLKRAAMVVAMLFSALLMLTPGAAQADGDNHTEDQHGIAQAGVYASQSTCSLRSNFASIPDTNGQSVDRMVWPISANANSEVGCRWHPISGGYKAHNGRDMAARAGTSVVAAYMGKVTSISSSCDGIIEVTHASGYMTRYVHTKSHVSYGDVVQKGQHIGEVAVTRNFKCSTAPHLHFEIRRHGVPINWDDQIPRGTWVSAGNSIAVDFAGLAKATCNGKAATLEVYPGSWLNGTEGDDVIVGSESGDVINGAGGNDLICGKGGNDAIRGGEGNDTLYGQNGADRLFGEGGNDKLYGQNSSDFIRGGQGHDELHGNGGNDTLYGDPGDDYLAGGNSAYDNCYGGAGRDWTTPNDGCDEKYSLDVLHFSPPVTNTNTTTQSNTSSSSNVGEFVAISGYNNEAWILRTDGTRQWIDGTCRNQLVSTVGQPRLANWNNELANRADTPGHNRLSCNDLQAGLRGSSSTTTTTNPTTTTTQSNNSGLELVALNGYADAWILFSDGTRQWINESCRTQLVNAGQSVRTADWNTEVGNRADTGNRLSCNDLQAALSGSSSTTNPTNNTNTTTQNTTSGLELVALNGYADAWILSNDGTRQWISESCRTQLVNAGKSLRTADWNTEVGNRADTGNRLSCNDLQSRL